MTQSYWPFDGIDTTETQYSQLFRRLQSTGVWGSPGDTALKLTGDSSGLNVKLAAGYAFIQGYMYYTDAVVTIPIEVGDTTARTDIVVLRADPVSNAVTPTVIKGTPGSPAPDPVQTDTGAYDLLIGKVSVAANVSTITSDNVTDERTFMGHIYGLWKTSTRPVNPRPGQPGFNSTTLLPEYHDGTGWESFIPDLSTASVANADKVGGKTIFVQSATPSGAVTNDLWLY